MALETISGAGGALVAAIQPLKEALGIRPEKAFIGNLTTGESVELLVNPGQFSEAYKANYARVVSPGLSHQRMQYTGSPNLVLNIKAYFDQLSIEVARAQGRIQTSVNARGFEEPDEVAQARQFLISVVTPRGGTRLKSIAPTPVLFVWPGLIEMRMRVTAVTFDHIMFRVGKPLARAYNVDIQLEEAVLPGQRVFAEDVRRIGTKRPWAGRRG